MLVLDPAKAHERLGWRARLDLNTALDWAVSWYKDWYRGGDARALTDAQIARFTEIRQS